MANGRRNESNERTYEPTNQRYGMAFILQSTDTVSCRQNENKKKKKNIETLKHSSEEIF